MDETRPRHSTTRDASAPVYISGLVSDGKSGTDEQDLGERDTVRHLVARAQRGDREAFGQLYLRYHAPLYRLARLHLRVEAEDAVAETFARAWASLPRYRDTGAPFVAWLYGIARHVVVDEIRRSRRSELRAQWPDMPMEAGQDDDRLALAAAIDRLPQEHRQVIELKFLVGLTNEDIARALGKSPGAVNAIRWRALRALRHMVDRG